MSNRRVVITGLGFVAPFVCTASGLWDLLTSPQTSSRNHSALFDGNISDFESQDTVQQKVIRKSLKVMSREIQMAVAASCRALNCAGVQIGQFPADRVGISFGADYILTTAEDVLDGITSSFEFHVSSKHEEQGTNLLSCWGTRGLPKMQPLWQLKYLPNMPSSHIAILNDFHGPSNSMTLREASVGAVIGESVRIIQDGRADIMVAGATGSRLHPYKYIHATQQEELAQMACRPFDLYRDGTTLGEGAGCVILEELTHAEKRGADIWAEVAAGAYRFAPLASVLKTVLRSANTDIGHINAHGLGGRAADAAEAAAIIEVFDKDKPVSALKGIFGNIGAGGGVLELIAGVLALKNGFLPPTANYETPDEKCPIRVVKDNATPAGKSFVKLAYNHQGQTSAVVVKSFQ